jgi:ribose transport system permease protein
LKGGRFNAWGTLIGVVMLATLTVGLSLAGKANWFQDLSTGLVLIAALAVTSLQVRSAGGASLRSRFLRRGRG